MRRAISFEEIIPGTYRVRLVRGGLFVGVRFWHGQPTFDGDELDRSPRWNVEVDGRTSRRIVDDDGNDTGVRELLDPWEVWPFAGGNPISEQEFAFLARRREWAEQNDPEHPAAQPRKAIDVRKLRPDGDAMTDAPLPLLTHDMRIRDVAGLSVRAVNSLEAGGVETVGAAAMKTDRELLRLLNFGPQSLIELRAAIPYWTDQPVRADRCERCKFWDGRCHRHAPRASSVPVPVFPRTAPGEWCGEFEHRPPSAILRQKHEAQMTEEPAS